MRISGTRRENCEMWLEENDTFWNRPYDIWFLNYRPQSDLWFEVDLFDSTPMLVSLCYVRFRASVLDLVKQKEVGNRAKLFRRGSVHSIIFCLAHNALAKRYHTQLHLSTADSLECMKLIASAHTRREYRQEKRVSEGCQSLLELPR